VNIIQRITSLAASRAGFAALISESFERGLKVASRGRPPEESSPSSVSTAPPPLGGNRPRRATAFVPCGVVNQSWNVPCYRMVTHRGKHRGQLAQGARVEWVS
jgi:hypothetical protein